MNISFDKNPMSWKLIHWRILHPSDIGMKLILLHQNINGLPKNCPNKINKASCKTCYTEKITTFPKGKTFNITNLCQGELIQIISAFYNMTSIWIFTSMFTVLCARTRMLSIFTTAKQKKPSPYYLLHSWTLNN